MKLELSYRLSKVLFLSDLDDPFSKVELDVHTYLKRYKREKVKVSEVAHLSMSE